MTINLLPTYKLYSLFLFQQVELAEKLYEAGIIVTKTPLQPLDDEDQI